MDSPVKPVPSDGLAAEPSDEYVAYDVSSQLNPAALSEVEIDCCDPAVVIVPVTVAYKLNVLEVSAAIVYPSKSLLDSVFVV